MIRVLRSRLNVLAVYSGVESPKNINLEEEKAFLIQNCMLPHEASKLEGEVELTKQRLVGIRPQLSAAVAVLRTALENLSLRVTHSRQLFVSGNYNAAVQTLSDVQIRGLGAIEQLVEFLCDIVLERVSNQQHASFGLVDLLITDTFNLACKKNR